MIELSNGLQTVSSYISKNIRRVENACAKGNTLSCQHLANMCVLQNYQDERPSACTLFKNIAKNYEYKRS